MSIFKTIGTKLKRAISIKNLTRAVTGNFSAIGSDVLRIATTKSPSEVKNGLSSQEITVKPFVIPTEINTLISAKESQYKTAVSSKLADLPVVQNISDILSKTYIQSMWLKYKAWIIGFLATLVLFLIGWKILKKPSIKRARARR